MTDPVAAAVEQADRARRAEAEVDRLHNWLDDDQPGPRPRRPHWAPRTLHARFDPPYTQPEAAGL